MTFVSDFLMLLYTSLLVALLLLVSIIFPFKSALCLMINIQHCNYYTFSVTRKEHLTFFMRWLLTAQWWQWWGVAAPLLLRRWPKSVTTQTYQW